MVLEGPAPIGVGGTASSRSTFWTHNSYLRFELGSDAASLRFQPAADPNADERDRDAARRMVAHPLLVKARNFSPSNGQVNHHRLDGAGACRDRNLPIPAHILKWAPPANPRHQMATTEQIFGAEEQDPRGAKSTNKRPAARRDFRGAIFFAPPTGETPLGGQRCGLHRPLAARKREDQECEPSSERATR